MLLQKFYTRIFKLWRPCFFFFFFLILLLSLEDEEGFCCCRRTRTIATVFSACCFARRCLVLLTCRCCFWIPAVRFAMLVASLGEPGSRSCCCVGSHVVLVVEKHGTMVSFLCLWGTVGDERRWRRRRLLGERF